VVKTIAGSLRGPEPLARANAAEALESLTAPRTAALVAPLFEPDLPPAQLLPLVERACGAPIPTAAAALRLLLVTPAMPGFAPLPPPRWRS